MRFAANIASGAWLEELDQFTYLKGPGYPFFLAVTNLSSLPLSAAHALFQTAAISVAAWAVFRLTRSSLGAAASFVALAFCPVGIALHRVLPDQIYWAQTLLVFSLLAIIVFAPPRRSRSATVMTGFAGLIFGWTWFTCNDGVWFLPAFAVLIAGPVLATWHSGDKRLALARNLSVAGAGFVVVNVAFLAGTFNAYGSVVGVKFGARYFTSMSLMTNHQWTLLPHALVVAVEAVSHPDLAAAMPYCSVSVASDDFKRYWTFLNMPLVKVVQPSRQVTGVGWYYDKQSNEWPIFKAYDQDGQEIPSSVTRLASPDVQRFYSDDRAAYDRFEIMFRGPDVCAITARASDRPELRVVIDPKGDVLDASGSALLYVQSVSDSGGGFVKRDERLAAFGSLSLIAFYEGLLPFLLSIGLIAAIAASWRAFSTQAWPGMLLTALAAWVLAATRIIFLALITTGASPEATIHYSQPATYIAIVAASLSLTALSAGFRPE